MVLSAIPGRISPALSLSPVNHVRSSVRLPYLRRSIAFPRRMSIDERGRARSGPLIIPVEIHRNGLPFAVFSGDYFTALLPEAVQSTSPPANTTEKRTGNLGKKRSIFLNFPVLSLGKTGLRRRSRHSAGRFFQCLSGYLDFLQLADLAQGRAAAGDQEADLLPLFHRDQSLQHRADTDAG